MVTKIVGWVSIMALLIVASRRPFASQRFRIREGKYKKMGRLSKVESQVQILPVF